MKILKVGLMLSALLSGSIFAGEELELTIESHFNGEVEKFTVDVESGQTVTLGDGINYKLVVTAILKGEILILKSKLYSIDDDDVEQLVSTPEIETVLGKPQTLKMAGNEVHEDLKFRIYASR